MPPVKRPLDTGALYARQQAQAPRQAPKRRRVETPPHLSQESHLQRARAQGPRTPLGDITPPGSAVEPEKPFPGAESPRSPSLPPTACGSDSGSPERAAEPSPQNLAELIGRLNADEARGLLLTYASSYQPLSDAIAALVNKPSTPRQDALGIVHTEGDALPKPVPSVASEPQHPTPSDTTETTRPGEAGSHPSTRVFDFAAEQIGMLLYRAEKNPGGLSPAQWAQQIAGELGELTEDMMHALFEQPPSTQDKLNACSAMLDVAWAVVLADGLTGDHLRALLRAGCSVDLAFEQLWVQIGRNGQEKLLRRRQWNGMLFEEQARKLENSCALEGIMPGLGRCFEPLVRSSPHWQPPSQPPPMVDRTFHWAAPALHSSYKLAMTAGKVHQDDMAFECVWLIRHVVTCVCSSSVAYGTPRTRRNALHAMARVINVTLAHRQTSLGALVLKHLEAESASLGDALFSLVDAMGDVEIRETVNESDIEGTSGRYIAAFLYKAATSCRPFRCLREAASRLVDALPPSL